MTEEFETQTETMSDGQIEAGKTGNVGFQTKSLSSEEDRSNSNATRRNFLAKLGVGVVAAAGSATLLAKTVEQGAGTGNTQYAMVIDTRRCIGCHACSVSCKSENDVPLGKFRSWVEYIEKGQYPDTDRSYLPRLCNQCSNPPCVRVCPVEGATYKREEDGVVVVDPEVCTGMGFCVRACPYDARYISPVTNKAEKCDFCLHRITQGVAPACVNTCQGKARIFGDINDVNSEVSKLLAKNAYSVLLKGRRTEPNVFYIDADHSDQRDALYQNRYIRISTHRERAQRK